MQTFRRIEQKEMEGVSQSMVAGATPSGWGVFVGPGEISIIAGGM